MTKAEKIRKIQEVLELKNPQENLYADLLKTMGDLKTNYGDYMITEPIDCNEELKRISGADYELCTALLTMMLREDHFSNGSFDRRFADGQVLPVLMRMKDVLSVGVRSYESRGYCIYCGIKQVCERGGDPQVFRRDVPGTFYRYGWRNTGEGSQAVCNEGRS